MKRTKKILCERHNNAIHLYFSSYSFSSSFSLLVPMPRRPAMLASEIRRYIAPVLRECPPECGIVTITEIDVAVDTSVITVCISALQNPEIALAFMEERRKELRHALGALQLHRIPELRFSIDPRSERGSRIEKILTQETSKKRGRKKQ